MNTTLQLHYKKTEVVYRPYHTSMLDLVLVITAAIATLAAVFSMCCYCMSRSDKKLQTYVLALAKQCGRPLDAAQLQRPPLPTAPLAESCPVLLADAGFVVP